MLFPVPLLFRRYLSMIMCLTLLHFTSMLHYFTSISFTSLRLPVRRYTSNLFSSWILDMVLHAFRLLSTSKFPTILKHSLITLNLVKLRRRSKRIELQRRAMKTIMLSRQHPFRWRALRNYNDLSQSIFRRMFRTDRETFEYVLGRVESVLNFDSGKAR